MRSADLLHFNLQLVLRHRFRSLMILLALAIGVAAVNLLTGLGEGAKTYVLSQFSLLGNETLILLPGKKETRGGMPPLTGESPRDITLDDASAISRLPGVVAHHHAHEVDRQEPRTSQPGGGSKHRETTRHHEQGADAANQSAEVSVNDPRGVGWHVETWFVAGCDYLEPGRHAIRVARKKSAKALG